jgi:hypothetical protein
VNRFRVTAAAVGTAVVLVALPQGQAAAGPPDRAVPGRAATSAGGTGTADVPAPCTGVHGGDPRLGPAHLAEPWQRPLGPLLAGWDRTGGTAPEVFLDKFWENDGWKYPPNDGFAEVNGAPDKQRERLRRGERLDRFGSEYGRFLAPAGAPYALRSLPPQSLTTREAAHPCNYHVYRVTRPFTVWQGGIAPWFGQPGGGEQILLDPELLPAAQRPGEGEWLHVKWLVDHGYLAPVALDRV